MLGSCSLDTSIGTDGGWEARQTASRDWGRRGEGIDRETFQDRSGPPCCHLPEPSATGHGLLGPLVFLFTGALDGGGVGGVGGGGGGADSRALGVRC